MDSLSSYSTRHRSESLPHSCLPRVAREAPKKTSSPPMGGGEDSGKGVRSTDVHVHECTAATWGIASDHRKRGNPTCLHATNRQVRATRVRRPRSKGVSPTSRIAYGVREIRPPKFAGSRHSNRSSSYELRQFLNTRMRLLIACPSRHTSYDSSGLWYRLYCKSTITPRGSPPSGS